MAKAYVIARGDAGRVAGDLKRSKPDITFAAKGLGQAMSVAFGNVISRMALRAVAAIRQVISESLMLAERQVQSEQKIAAVVKATGAAAGFTAEQLKEQARALQEVTTVGDEEILDLQSILLTFKAITGDVFESASERALDLAAVMGTDARSGAIQLGKALEDPVRGVTALRRAGVSFSEEEKKKMKVMVDSGRLTDAQTMILKALETQVGGVAKQLAKTDFGKLKQLKNRLGDLREELGKKLVPIMNTFVGIQVSLQKVINVILDRFSWLLPFLTVFGTIAMSLIGIIMGLVLAWKAYKIAQMAAAKATIIFQAAADPTVIKKIATALLALAAAGGAIYAVNAAMAGTTEEINEAVTEAKRLKEGLDEISATKPEKWAVPGIGGEPGLGKRGPLLEPGVHGVAELGRSLREALLKQDVQKNMLGELKEQNKVLKEIKAIWVGKELPVGPGPVVEVLGEPI